MAKKKESLTMASLEMTPVTVKADAMKPNDTPITNTKVLKIPASKGGYITREDYK